MQVLANFLGVLFFHNSIKDNSGSESVLLLRLSSLYLCAKVGKLSSNIMCLLPLFTNNNPPFFKKAHFCSSSIVAFIEAAARRLVPSTSTTSTLSFEAATASIYYTSSRHETTSKRVLL